MKTFDVIELIEKLIGEITPVGDTCVDEERFENLKNMCELTNELVTKIDNISYRYKDSYEHSVKKASKYAENFITETLGIKD